MKITPKIKKYITENNTLSSRVLSDRIKKNFGIDVSYRAIEPHLSKARIATQADNEAKVEAVRAEVLGDAQRFVGPYLGIVDRDIKAWDALLTTGMQTFPLKEGETEAREIVIKDVRDRATASQSLQKAIGLILEFAKPSEGNNVNVNLKPDPSKLSVEELRQLRSIRAKLEGDRPGTGEAKSS